MFSGLRKRVRVSPATMIACLALVFAMSGGAYAISGHGGSAGASGGSSSSSSSGGASGGASREVAVVAKAKKKTTTSTGKPGPRGPAGPAGAQGPAGPAGAKGENGAAGGQGPQGSPGTNGTDGTNGTNGTNGANGKSVLSGATAPSGSVGEEGDFYIETKNDKIYGPKTASGWGTGTELKGKTGEPWSAGGTLPPGQSEYGNWAGQAIPDNAGIGARISISFPVWLPKPVKAYYMKEGEVSQACPGNSAKPEAVADVAKEEGVLCVYPQQEIGLLATYLENVEICTEKEEEEAKCPSEGSEPKSNTAGKAGALLTLAFNEASAGSNARGVWAVTAG